MAADVRAKADGRRGAKLKLIAGLLNVRLDELIRHDNARRQRRLAIVTSSAFAGMTLAKGLAVFAYLQREQAMMEEARALQEAATAECVVDFVMSVFEASNPEVEHRASC